MQLDGLEDILGVAELGLLQSSTVLTMSRVGDCQQVSIISKWELIVHCALIEVSTKGGCTKTNADSHVCYQDGSSEHSPTNWEQGKVVFLALNKHNTT